MTSMILFRNIAMATPADFNRDWLETSANTASLGLLLFAGAVREFRFIFPAWVFLVSVYILILNYRRTHHQEGQNELSLVD